MTRSTARLACILSGVLLVGAAAVPTTAKLADAHETSPDQRLRSYQKPLLDAEAPSGTDVTSAHTAMHEDAVANTASPDVSSVLEALPAAVGGRWTHLQPLPAGFNAYHMIMGPGGKILLMAGSGNNAEMFRAGTFKAYIWSPTKGITKTLQTPTDMFCSGHMLMSNGQGIDAGGTAAYSPWKGSKGLYTFDFATLTFRRQSDLAHGRWYPSVVNTPTGDAMITGGFDEQGMNSGTTEMYHPSTHTHTQLAGAQKFPLYPHLFLTRDQRYFFTGEGWANNSNDTVVHPPGFWDPTHQNAFTPIPGLTNSAQRGSGASCFVGDVRRQQLMVLGGGWPATDSTNLVDLSAKQPAYRSAPSLPAAKAYVSCVDLPDGTLLEANGGSANAIASASREVSLLKSATSSAWTPLNPLPTGEHRLYHSVLFLTDDGNVISMGSNPKGEARSDTVLKYEPPYQFRGTRPTLNAVPAALHYGQTYAIGASADVTSVAIDVPQSPTHSSNPNMRMLVLPVTNGRITAAFNAAQFPPGYVRLWARNAQGAISVAKWTKLS